MKLSTRYSRVNLLTSLIVLLITGICYYAVIHFILTRDLDKDLRVEEEEIVEYVKLYHVLPPPGNYQNQIVRYQAVQADPGRKFYDTEYINSKENEREPGRSLVTTVRVNNELVKVEIIKSKVESEDLIRIIFLITLSITVLLLVSLALVNRFVLNRLWKPFHAILGQLRAFHVAGNQEMYLEPTKIDEFVELNKAAISLTSRVKQDYADLKVFTDNASHEMMTPLAVLQSKLDTLLQTGSFTEVQGEIVNDIFSGINRLTRLNQSMLLMAKIENNLIHDSETISINGLIEQKIQYFQELLQSKEISVTTQLEEKSVQMSLYLSDILLNNLISNAIRHNHPKGTITISLTQNQLLISNTGKAQKLTEEKIFDRFSKGSGSDGMGLGLAISKQICSSYNYQLHYDYQNLTHCFMVTFGPDNL